MYLSVAFLISSGNLISRVFVSWEDVRGLRSGMWGPETGMGRGGRREAYGIWQISRGVRCEEAGGGGRRVAYRGAGTCQGKTRVMNRLRIERRRRSFKGS